ncbi:MAG TPA: DUF1428 domain-containing protein [Sphingomonas sp.]|nr:DUF1428 domain-containing protein [Sphingomonas sp.]
MTYIQGFVVPVPNEKKQAYRDMAADAASFFREYGALRIVECWGEDVPDGKVTDFRRAVQAGEGENVVFSWIVWPDRATCDAAAEKMQTDERMKMPGDMPFDGKRMIYGGFAPIFDTED